MNRITRLLLGISLPISLLLGVTCFNAQGQELTINNTTRQRPFPLAIGISVQQRIERITPATERWYTVRLFPGRSYDISAIPQDTILSKTTDPRPILRLSVFDGDQTKPLVTSDDFSTDVEPSLGLGARAGFAVKGTDINPLVGPSRAFSIKLEGQDPSTTFGYQVIIQETTQYGHVPPGLPFTINVTNTTGDQVFLKSIVTAGSDRAPANTGFANAIPGLTTFVSPEFLSSPLMRAVVLQQDGPPGAIKAYIMARDPFSDQKIILPLEGR